MYRHGERRIRVERGTVERSRPANRPVKNARLTLQQRPSQFVLAEDPVESSDRRVAVPLIPAHGAQFEQCHRCHRVLMHRVDLERLDNTSRLDVEDPRPAAVRTLQAPHSFKLTASHRMQRSGGRAVVEGKSGRHFDHDGRHSVLGQFRFRLQSPLDDRFEEPAHLG